MNSSERRKQGHEIAVINRRLENEWLPKVKKAVSLPFTTVAGIVQRRGVAAARQWIDAYVINARLSEVLRDLYRKVGLRHARHLNAQLNAEPMTLKRDGRLGLNQQWIDFIQQYLEEDNLSKLVLEITATNKAMLLKALMQGVEEGLGIDDIVRLIKNWPGKTYQAARVVRTEINKAANAGMLAASKTFPFEQSKEWIAVMDNRVRGRKPEDHASHVALDARSIDYEDTWTDPRNGDELRAPGDPKASAASVVNCRCTMGITAKRDANGRMIPKHKPTSRISVILPGQVRQPVTVTI